MPPLCCSICDQDNAGGDLQTLHNLLEICLPLFLLSLAQLEQQGKRFRACAASGSNSEEKSHSEDSSPKTILPLPST